MDWSFLYGWDGYYFLQGFWLDIKLLIANAKPITVIVCFVSLLVLMLVVERRRAGFGGVMFSIAVAVYGTFLLTVTLLGRNRGNVSSWDQLLRTYERALEGEDASKFDILYNIVLYVPVGMLISHYRNNRIDIIILAAMPTAIELTQLVTTRGVFELTDIINNSIGGFIGLGFARLSISVVEVIYMLVDNLTKYCTRGIYMGEKNNEQSAYKQTMIALLRRIVTPVRTVYDFSTKDGYCFD